MIATGLNVSKSNEYREQILAETFQVYSCKTCSEKFMLDEPFIYTDFTRNHWIGVFPANGEPAWVMHERAPLDAFEKNMSGPHTSPIARAMAEGFLVRTVFGLEALREKLVVFDAGIDDAVLALLKIELMRAGLVPFHPDARPRLKAADQEQLFFNHALRVPRKLLEEMTADSAFDEMLLTLREGPYVDAGRVLIPGTIS